MSVVGTMSFSAITVHSTDSRWRRRSSTHCVLLRATLRLHDSESKCLSPPCSLASEEGKEGTFMWAVCVAQRAARPVETLTERFQGAVRKHRAKRAQDGPHTESWQRE